MTYEGALGRPIEDLDDASLAVAGFAYAKHGTPDGEDWLEATQDKIRAMDNVELIAHMALAFEALEYSKLDREENLLAGASDEADAARFGQ